MTSEPGAGTDPAGPEFVVSDIAVLVPTMNRPQQLTRLLESLSTQSDPVGRIVIVDGHVNAEPVCAAFADRLPVEYYQCHPPGQIRQRSFGLAQLSDRDRLVALLDDDMVLERDCLAEMIACWNRITPNAAGVAFNIVSGAPQKTSLLHELMGLRSRTPGRVQRSGMTSAVSHMSEDMRVEWLPGGATVWRREVLLEHPHEDIRARWAIAEDLIFSYPVGMVCPLFVASRARAHHFHVSDYSVSSKQAYHGRVQTLWMFHFVASNEGLSEWRYFWVLGIRILGRLARGVVHMDLGSFRFAGGQLSAIWAIMWNAVLGGDRRDLLAEDSQAQS